MGSNPVRRQLSLLTRAPSFGYLFLATLGSGLGTGIALIALTVDVFDRTGSGKWVAALLIVELLPMLAIGLLLGPLLDRFSRRRLMIGSDLVRFAIFAALPFAPGPVAVIALAGVAGFATGFFRPAVYAGMPNLVDKRDLPQANALFQAVDNLTWMLGPLIGGMILAASGPGLAYWVNSVTFLVSAALLVRIPARLLQLAQAASEGHWRDLAEGFRLVRSSRPLLTVLVTWTIAMIAIGHMNVAEVALAKVVFEAGDFGLGVLMASSGLGLIVGSLAGGTVIERRGIATAYGGAIALMAVGLALAAVSPGVWIAAALLVGVGIGNGVAGVCNPLLVQRGAPDRLRGRSFTVIMSVNAAMLALAMALAGPLTDALGARWVWGIAAAVYAVAAVVAVALARGIRIDTVPDDLDAVVVVGAGAPHAVTTDLEP